MNPASQASPFTQARMFYVFMLIPTIRADLSRGERLPHFHNGFPVPVGLIFEHAEELRPTDIADELAQSATLLYIFHLQCLNADDVVVFDDLGRYLMQEIGALVHNFLMDTSDLFFCF